MFESENFKTRFVLHLALPRLF